MPWRKGHGNGAGIPRMEVCPSDELPDPVAGQAAPLTRTVEGKIADSETARALGRKGGLARQNKLRFINALGLRTLPDEAVFKPYAKAAEDWIKAKLVEAAAMGGGVCGVGVSSLIASAGRRYATSLYLYDRGAAEENPKLLNDASNQDDKARILLMTAHDMVVKEAKVRSEETNGHPYEGLLEAAEADED